MSIARRLNAENTEIAQRLFPSVAMNYLCDSLVIRKFNESRKHFDIVARFTFKSHMGLTI